MRGPDSEGSAQDKPPSCRLLDPVPVGSRARSHVPSPGLVGHCVADSPGLAHVPSGLQQNARCSSRGFDLKLFALLLAKICLYHTWRRLDSIYSTNICLQEILIIIFHNEKNKKRVIKSHNLFLLFMYVLMDLYLWIYGLSSIC